MIGKVHESAGQLDGLVKLARQELRGDTLLSDGAGFARLQARMDGRKRGRERRWVVGGGVAFGFAALTAAVLFLRAPSQKLSFEVAGGALDAVGRVVGREHTQIRFSDGSEATLEPGAEASVANVSEHGAKVILGHGRMRMQVKKKPLAVWHVEAGPYDVRVTGTAFDVSWSAQSQLFDLRMATGSVIVTGPLASSGIVLRAGQHLFGGGAEGHLTVEGGEAAASAPQRGAEREQGEQASPPAPAQALPPSEDAAPTPSPVPATRAATASELAWSKQVAQGHFNAVVDEAEQRGLERLLASSSLEELAALADAARYSGRNAVAERVLLAERQRFPNSAAARDAAFFLGRIAEDAGGGMDWYERYINESPRGAYASQAFGRKMMLLYKQRGAAAAKPVAADYLTRYPRGPYAAAARKIEQESPSTSKP